jgi:hypothetical protein
VARTFRRRGASGIGCSVIWPVSSVVTGLAGSVDRSVSAESDHVRSSTSGKRPVAAWWDHVVLAVGRAGHPVDAIVLGSAGPGIAAMGRMSVGCAAGIGLCARSSGGSWPVSPKVALPGVAASGREHAIRVRARVTHDRLAYDRQPDGHPRGRHPRAFPANLGSTEQRSASQQVAGRTLHPGRPGGGRSPVALG